MSHTIMHAVKVVTDNDTDCNDQRNDNIKFLGNDDVATPRSFLEGNHQNSDVIERVSEDDMKDDCAICLCELYGDLCDHNDDECSDVCVLPCSHRFHSECMIKLRSSESAKLCPLCRADLPVDPEEQNEEAGVKFHELDAQIVSGLTTWDDPAICAELKIVIDLWKESALSGNAKAQCNLGLMYKRGRGVVQSDEESLYWYNLSANQGNTNAMYNMGMIYEKGTCVDEDLRVAVSWFLAAAADGQPRAEYAMGSLFERGLLDEFNGEFSSFGTDSKADAFLWFKRAALQGFSAGQCSLGVLYEQGEGCEQSDEEALNWYMRAAMQGDAPAQTNLATMYNDGRGVAQNNEEAFRWYDKAAKQGFARAQCNLGYKYDKGEGVTQSDREAARWYRLSAVQGNPSACCNLGVMLEQGRVRSTLEDKVEAVYWYEQGGDMDHIDSLVNLALLYESGYGNVASDPAAALCCFVKARELGDDTLDQHIDRLENIILHGGEETDSDSSTTLQSNSEMGQAGSRERNRKRLSAGCAIS